MAENHSAERLIMEIYATQSNCRGSRKRMFLFSALEAWEVHVLAMIKHASERVES